MSDASNPFGPPPSIFDDTTSSPPPLPFNTTDHLFNQNVHGMSSSKSANNNPNSTPSSQSNSIYSPSPKITTPIIDITQSPTATPSNINTNNTNPISIPSNTSNLDNNSSENTSPGSKDNETNDTNDTNDTEEDWGAPPDTQQESMLPETNPTITTTPTPKKKRVSRFSNTKPLSPPPAILSHSRPRLPTHPTPYPHPTRPVTLPPGHVPSPMTPNLNHNPSPSGSIQPIPVQPLHPHLTHVRPDGYNNTNVYISPNGEHTQRMIMDPSNEYGAPPEIATQPLLMPPPPSIQSRFPSNIVHTPYPHRGHDRYSSIHHHPERFDAHPMRNGNNNNRHSRSHSVFGDRKRKRSPSYSRYDHANNIE